MLTTAFGNCGIWHIAYIFHKIYDILLQMVCFYLIKKSIFFHRYSTQSEADSTWLKSSNLLFMFISAFSVKISLDSLPIEFSSGLDQHTTPLHSHCLIFKFQNMLEEAMFPRALCSLTLSWLFLMISNPLSLTCSQDNFKLLRNFLFFCPLFLLLF